MTSTPTSPSASTSGTSTNKRQADKRVRIFEDLNRPVTYILDDVKETIVTENTYKAIPYNVLKTYFLPKGMF